MIYSFLRHTGLFVSPLLSSSLIFSSLFVLSPLAAQEDTPNTPLVGTCIDSDGDGFGWNGFATCDPTIAENILEPAPCIDTDGDGFGFDGINSCRVDGTPVFPPAPTFVPAPSVGLCIDSDGDGFGWDGLATCLVDDVDNSTIAACVDTDGDGFGWNGFETCLNINFVQPPDVPDVNGDVSGDSVPDVFQTANAAADTNGNTIFDFFELPIGITVVIGTLDSITIANLVAVNAMDVNSNGVDDTFEAALTGGADDDSDGLDDVAAADVADFFGVLPNEINQALIAAANAALPPQVVPDVDGDGIPDVFQTTNAVADANGNTIFDFFELPIDVAVVESIGPITGELDFIAAANAAAATAVDANNNSVDDSYEAAVTGGADNNNDGFDDEAAAGVVAFFGVPLSEIDQALIAAANAALAGEDAPATQ